MLLDQNVIFSDEQKLTATAESEQILDLDSAGNPVSGSVFFVCRTAEAFAGCTALDIRLETADEADFTAADVLLAKTFGVDELGAEKILLAAALPQGVKRYLRVKYQMEGSATSGSISSFLTDSVDLK